MQKAQSGFTVIEVVLFLAVSGLVLSIMMVGIGAGVNRERYRDATNSYLDYWQGAYNNVTNVRNARTGAPACNLGTSIAGTSSDCSIVGRVFHSSADGAKVTSAAVYAHADTAAIPILASDTDESILAKSGLKTDVQTTDYMMNWGTKIVNAKDGRGSQFSILIVRMPTSGQVRTFVTLAANRTPTEIVSAGVTKLKDDFTMCVATSGLVQIANMGVRIAQNATNSNAVTYVGEGGGC